MPLLLARADVESVLTMPDAITAVEEAFKQLALGNVVMPQRTAIRAEQHHGLHLGMPAYIGGENDTLGLKIVTVYGDNPAKYNLPTTIGILVLNDPRTGAPIAIMDASYLTAMRTGAVSGVATKYLARRDAKTAGIFGAGVQARTQLVGVAASRQLESALVYSLVAEEAARYAGDMSAQLGIPVRVAGSAEAVLEADIICTASTATTPLFSGNALRPGTHINGVGSHSPGARELDTDTIKRAKVIADQKSACLVEAGDIMIPIEEGSIGEDHISAELGEVVAGMKPGRESDTEITLFKSVGLALQDVSTATAVYHAAREKGIGQEVAI